MKLLLCAIAVLMLGAAPAAADPISTAIAAALTSAGVGATAAAAIGSALVRFAAGAVFNALARALAPKRKQRQGGIKTDVRLTGGTNPQSFILGRYGTAGARVCAPMSHGDDNKGLTYVLDLSDVPVKGISRVWIDGEEAVFDQGDDPDYPIYGPYAGGRWVRDGREKVWMRFHDGTQTEADAFLLDKYSDYPDRPWQADMVLRGVAYAAITFWYDTELFSGLPSVRFEVEGVSLYDPRADSSVGGSGSQRWADPSTWAFTTNPMVMVYNILRGITLPDGSLWGVGAAAADLPFGAWVAAMNACDEQVATDDGGTRTRYQAGLEVAVDEAPLEIIDELLKACGGDVAECGGYWFPSVGAPDSPSLYVTDDDLLITEPRDFEPFPGLDQTYNAVAATYSDPESVWESTEAVPLYNATWEAEDRGRRLTAELQLDAVPYPRQVRAQMRELAADNRRHRIHTISLAPDALGLLPLQTLSWTSGFNGYSDKLFEVQRRVLDPQTLCSGLMIRERDPSDYDPDAASDAVVPTPPGHATVTPVVDGIDGWTVAAVVVEDDAGDPRRPAIRMSWSQEIVADAVAWEITVAATGALAARGTTSDVSEGLVIVEGGILPATTYQVRGRAILRREALWTATVSVTTDAVRLSLADLQADVTGWLETMRDWITGGVTDLPGDLTGLSQAIAAEAQTRAAAIQDAADALTAEQAARVEDAQLLATRLRSTSDRVRALTAQAQELAAASHTAREEIRRTLVVEIEEMRASFSEEIVTLADAQLAAALRLTTLEAESADLSADITQVDQARVEGDQALSQLITALNVGTAVSFDQLHIWYFDSTAEGWTGTPANPTPEAGGYIRPAEGAGATVVSPAGLAVDPDQYRQVRLRLQRSGTPTWVGWLWWAGEGQGWDTARRVAIPEPSWAGDEARLTINPDWTGEVDRIRLDLADQGASDYVEIDWIAVGRPAPGASSADLASLRQTVIDGDSALAEDITQLETELTSAQDSINGVAGAVDAVETRVEETEEGLTAQGTRLDGVETQLQGPNGLDALSEAIDTLTAETETQGDTVRTRSEALRSLRSAMRMLSSEAAEAAARDKLGAQAVREVIAEADQRLGTRIDATDGALEVVAEAVTALETAIPGLATSEALSSLSTTVTQQGDQLTSQGEAITSLQGEVAGKASSSALTSLSNTVSQQGSDITTNADAITTLQGEVAGKASSSALTSLSNTVSQQGEDITTNADAITSLQGEVAGKASSSALNSLSTTVSQQGSDITTNADAITSLQGEVAGKASSSALNSLSNTVSQQGNEITANANALTSLNAEVGKFSAQGLLRARVEATPAGASSRIGLYAAASAGEGAARPAALFLESVSGGGSRIVAQADRFAVTDGSGSVVPFVVAGGTVYIADARVRTLSIEAGGLTDMDTSGSGVVTNNSAFETTICQCSVNSGPGASKVIGQVTFNLTAPISTFPSGFEVRVYVGGQLRSQLTKSGMSAVPEQRRFDVQFPTDGITGNPVIRAAIVNAGGGGVDFSSIWALALKR